MEKLRFTGILAYPKMYMIEKFFSSSKIPTKSLTQLKYFYQGFGFVDFYSWLSAPKAQNIVAS
jgi:hypothetical protein